MRIGYFRNVLLPILTLGFIQTANEKPDTVPLDK